MAELQMHTEQFVQDRRSLPVAMLACQFGSEIPQLVARSCYPSFERRNRASRRTVTRTAHHSWARQVDPTERSVNATQLPVLDAQLLAATASPARFDDLGCLSGHKLVLNGANESLGFLEAQADIAGLMVLCSATDDQYAMRA